MTEPPRIKASAGTNTVSKFGAHARWALEKEGIDPETATVVILVKDQADKALMLAGILRHFNAQAMSRNQASPDKITIHGVPFIVSVRGA